MLNDTKGSKELLKEVIESGLCTLCGACAGSCPYLVTHKDKPILLDNCLLDEGQCYRYCPRTSTDIDAIYRQIFSVPYSEDYLGVGVIKDIFLGRSLDKDILAKAQDGGAVTSLLTAALDTDTVQGVVETGISDGRSPGGFIARSKEELLQGAGNSYEMAPVLETLNRIPSDSDEKLAVVGLPCHVMAIGKMKAFPSRNRVSIDNVKLVIGLFCGWALSPTSFHQYLQSHFNMAEIIKYDIPHHPAHSFDVYTKSGKTEIDLDEIREYINTACSYCCDMTSQFADVSVGSGRAMYKGWNTVIVRTEAGQNIVEIAKKKGLLETQPIPAESLTHLKKATLNKIARAINNITNLTGSKQDFGYLAVKPEMKEKITEILASTRR